MSTDPTARDDLLREFVDRVGPPGTDGAAPPPPVTGRPQPRSAKATLKAVLRRAARPIGGPVLRRVRGIADHAAEVAGDPIRHRLDGIESEVRRLEHDLAVERELVLAELDAGIDELRTAVDAERAQLADLGYAIAPSAGLPGAADRLAELRSRVNLLARRLDQPGPGPAAVSPLEPTPAPTPAPSNPVRPPFDYVGFEERFRGSSEELAADIESRYGDVLTDRRHVLDIGCGRGELLELVARHGGTAVGIDLDAGALAVAATKPGLEVHHGDALVHLAQQAPSTYDAICAIQVVEHLAFDDVLRLVDLAASRLQPGGLLLLETPNPTTLSVLGSSFILDPTHVWPLHPSLLTFVCERAGFAEIEVRYAAPMFDYHLPLLPDDAIGDGTEAFNEGLRRLNHVLFGPQDFAIVARAPGGSAGDDALADAEA
jgi:SAM-dependent methyltransferase